MDVNPESDDRQAKCVHATGSPVYQPLQGERRRGGEANPHQEDSSPGGGEQLAGRLGLERGRLEKEKKRESESIEEREIQLIAEKKKKGILDRILSLVYFDNYVSIF